MGLTMGMVFHVWLIDIPHVSGGDSSEGLSFPRDIHKPGEKDWDVESVDM